MLTWLSLQKWGTTLVLVWMSEVGYIVWAPEVGITSEHQKRGHRLHVRNGVSHTSDVGRGYQTRQKWGIRVIVSPSLNVRSGVYVTLEENRSQHLRVGCVVKRYHHQRWNVVRNSHEQKWLDGEKWDPEWTRVTLDRSQNCSCCRLSERRLEVSDSILTCTSPSQ